MRDIKFRAWDEKFKVMIPYVSVYDKNNLLIVDTVINESYSDDQIDERLDSLEYGGEEHYCMTKDFIPLQYTELNDTKGDEIYEGDIIEILPERSYRFGNIGKIEYNTDRAGFIVRGKYSRNQHHENLDCDIAAECIVIGNIYQNPELLQP